MAKNRKSFNRPHPPKCYADILGKKPRRLGLLDKLKKKKPLPKKLPKDTHIRTTLYVEIEGKKRDIAEIEFTVPKGTSNTQVAMQVIAAQDALKEQVVKFRTEDIEELTRE